MNSPAKTLIASLLEAGRSDKVVSELLVIDSRGAGLSIFGIAGLFGVSTTAFAGGATTLGNGTESGLITAGGAVVLWLRVSAIGGWLIASPRACAVKKRKAKSSVKNRLFFALTIKY